MRRLTGSQFDPAVIAAFEQLDPDQLAGLTPLTTWLDTPRSLHAVA